MGWEREKEAWNRADKWKLRDNIRDKESAMKCSHQLLGFVQMENIMDKITEMDLQAGAVTTCNFLPHQESLRDKTLGDIRCLVGVRFAASCKHSPL